MGKLYLEGYLDIPEDRRNEVQSALPEHIELTRQEAGCISFHVVEDTEIEGRLLVAEVFASRDAFDAHQRRAATSHWFKATRGIPRHYKITTDDPE